MDLGSPDAISQTARATKRGYPISHPIAWVTPIPWGAADPRGRNLFPSSASSRMAPTIILQTRTGRLPRPPLGLSLSPCRSQVCYEPEGKGGVYHRGYVAATHFLRRLEGPSWFARLTSARQPERPTMAPPSLPHKEHKAINPRASDVARFGVNRLQHRHLAGVLLRWALHSDIVTL
jgi:hypothetical protein